MFVWYDSTIGYYYIYISTFQKMLVIKLVGIISSINVNKVYKLSYTIYFVFLGYLQVYTEQSNKEKNIKYFLLVFIL